MRFLARCGMAAAFLAMAAAPAFAGDEAKVDTGDAAWMLVSTALVLMMTVPGVALFYAGMVRKKNVLATMMQSFSICALVSVLWMVAGYSLAFGEGNAWIGDFSRFFLGGLAENWDKPFTLGSGDAAVRNVQRDLPILEAYSNRLTLGLFSTAGSATASEASIPTRFVAKVDGSSAVWLQRARCCFAKQSAYRVRAGGQWLVSGTASGFLHHVVARESDGACTLSCDVADRLLNGRVFEIPAPLSGSVATAPGRRSRLAFRNPSFAFVLWSGENTSQRGWVWQFSTRGQFVPYAWDMGALGLTARTINVLLSEVVPLEPFGQLAVVDSGSRGIVVFDLSTMSFGANPYL